jgi:hypothetical protein
MSIDELSQIIRKVDGNHSLGAGALAEKILEELNKTHVIVPLEPSEEMVVNAYAVMTGYGIDFGGIKATYKAMLDVAQEDL